VEPNPELIEVGARIADGNSIDWASIESSTPEHERQVLRHLRVLQRIAQVHATPGAVSTPTHSQVNPVDAEAGRPTTWGPLTIVEQIGRGTYGDVYRALDPRLDRPVALKLLRRREKNADAVETTVIHEARLMARVRHPNVVTIYGAERIDGRVGLWMEFVGGRTMEDELRERGPFGATDLVVVGRHLAAALTAVHRAGLLHRDVKAQNAIRDADGRVLLTDFGAGNEVRDALDVGERHALAGTPLYLIPELT
jgi:eukaryotic-like serine/threonine-protein kinase